jgi:hypothetical protein
VIFFKLDNFQEEIKKLGILKNTRLLDNAQHTEIKKILLSKVGNERSESVLRYTWSERKEKIMRYIIATLLGFSMLGGTALASHDSKPGDILYKVKKAQETIRLKLTINETDKAKLTTRFALERINELEKLSAVDQQNFDNTQKITASTIQAEAKQNAQTEVSQAINALKEVQIKLEAKGNTEAAQIIGDNIKKLEGSAKKQDIQIENNYLNAKPKIIANPAFSGTEIINGTASAKIGSYILSAPNTENINLTALNFKILPNTIGEQKVFQNLQAKVEGNAFGATFPEIEMRHNYTFYSSGSFIIPAGESITINLFADIVANSGAMEISPATTFTGCEGILAVSGGTLKCDEQISGQNITLKSAYTPSPVVAFEAMPYSLDFNLNKNLPPDGMLKDYLTLYFNSGSKVSWKAKSSAEWLIVPGSGISGNGEKIPITIGEEATKLKQGNYPASIVFSSNGPVEFLNKTIFVTLKVTEQTFSLRTSPNPSFTGNEIEVGSPRVKVGSYIISNPNSVDFQLAGLTFRIQPNGGESSFGSLQAIIENISLGIIPEVKPGVTQTFNSKLTIPAGTSVVVDLFADVLTDAELGKIFPATTFVSCGGFLATQPTIVAGCEEQVDGQSMTLKQHDTYTFANPIGLLISPAISKFTLKQGAPLSDYPTSQITFSVNPKKTVYWTAESTADWLNISPSGSSSSGQTVSIEIGKSAEKLAPGIHKAYIKFESVGPPIFLGQSIAVELTIEPKTSVINPTKNSAFADSEVAVGSANIKIGSYVLSATNAEDIKLNSLTFITQPKGGQKIFQNLQVKIEGVAFGKTVAEVVTGQTYQFTPGHPSTIPAGGSTVINLYADIFPNSELGTITPATILIGCEGYLATSGGNANCGEQINGQNITLKTPQ